MPTQYHERCLKCPYLAPKLDPPCGRTFEAIFHVTPLGGKIDISFTPGMIPKEFEPKLEYMLSRVFEQVSIVVNQWPGWDELGEIMRSNPVKTDCPGREEIENPYLRLVKNDPALA